MGGKVLPLFETTRKLCGRSVGKVKNVCLFVCLLVFSPRIVFNIVIPPIVVISASAEIISVNVIRAVFN